MIIIGRCRGGGTERKREQLHYLVAVAVLHTYGAHTDRGFPSSLAFLSLALGHISLFRERLEIQKWAFGFGWPATRQVAKSQESSRLKQVQLLLLRSTEYGSTESSRCCCCHKAWIGKRASTRELQLFFFSSRNPSGAIGSSGMHGFRSGVIFFNVSGAHRPGCPYQSKRLMA